MKLIKTNTCTTQIVFDTYHYKNVREQLVHENSMNELGWECWDADYDDKKAWAIYRKEVTSETNVMYE